MRISSKYQSTTRQMQRNYQASNKRKTSELGADFWPFWRRFLMVFGVPKFWSILDPSWNPSWEPCWAKMGSLSFAKLLFWHFWAFLKSMNFETFFGRPSGLSWDRLGTLLAPFWEGFGGQNRCQHRPQRKCQNWAPVDARIENLS